jgi:hypothetical protein
MKIKPKILAIFCLLVFLCGAGLVLATRKIESTKAGELEYKRMTSSTKGQKKFDRLDCLAPLGQGRIVDTFVFRETSYVSPRGLPNKDYLVALKVEDHGVIKYSFQAVGVNKKYCSAYYTGPDDEVPNPLSRKFDKKTSREIQFLWEKWRLDNIPGWRETMQNYLSNRKPILSEEEVFSLRKLGFKMPKKWEEIK